MSEEENKKWKRTTKRYVAFLDILGFKDRVMRDEHEEVLEVLEIIQDEKNRLKEIAEGVDIITFSDSIIVYSNDGHESRLNNFMGTTLHIIKKCISLGVMIKGGAAYGKVTVDRKSQIYFGQAQIDAYLLEEDTEILGVLFHHSLDNKIKNIMKDITDQLLLKNIYSFSTKGKVPTKDGKLHYSIIFPLEKLREHSRIDEYNKERKLIIDSVKKLRENVTGRARRYIDNTLEFIDGAYPEYNKETKDSGKFKLDWGEVINEDAPLNQNT